MLKSYDRYSIHQILVTPIKLFGFPRLKDKLDALHWLRDKAEFNDLEYIYPLVFEKKIEFGLAAAQVVREVMVKTTGKQWGDAYDGLKYLRIDKEKLTTLLRYPENLSVHLLGIATLNSNGYVREKALRIISGVMNSDAVPYVLLRLSDWVEPIRKIAYHVLRNTLKTDNIDAFISNFYLIDKLKNVMRVDLNGVREEIVAYLKDESIVSRVKANLKHPHIKTRLFCYTILQDRLSSNEDVINLALVDKTFEVRLWLVRTINQLKHDKQSELINVLLHDKSVKVKVAILRNAEGIVYRDFKGQLLEMVCDEHLSARDEARYIARKYSLIEDFPNFYRERIKTQTSQGVILGLGETGNENDYALISEFALSENSKIRCAAMTAMWYLSKENTIEYILDCLDSNVSRVRKTAKRLLRTAKMYVVLPRMREKLKQDDVEMKMYALDVIYCYGGWQALENILWVISREDEMALTHAKKLLERWLWKSARFYAGIDAVTLNAITDYLEVIKVKNRISDKSLKQLEFIIQTRK